MKSIVDGARRLGPYLLVELFVPGGTLIAFLMWLRQQRRKAAPAT